MTENRSLHAFTSHSLTMHVTTCNLSEKDREVVSDAVLLSESFTLWEAIKALFGLSQVYDAWNKAVATLATHIHSRFTAAEAERAKESKKLPALVYPERSYEIARNVLNNLLTFERAFSRNPDGPRGSLGF